MKKFFMLLLLCILTITSFAQTTNQGFFVVKGEIRNVGNADTLNAYLTCFIGRYLSENFRMFVDKDGKFKKEIAIEGNQKLFIASGDFRAELYVKPNDTIIINYDKNNTANTFTIKGQTTERTNELNFNYQFAKEFDSKRFALAKRLNDEITKPDYLKASDSIRVSWVNSEYNQELIFIQKDPSLSKAIYDIYKREVYFFWMRELYFRVFLNRITELAKYDLTEDSKSILLPQPLTRRSQTIPQYRSLSLQNFYNVPAYREFIYNFGSSFFLEFSALPYVNIELNPGPAADSILNKNYLEKEYHLAMASVSLYPIRDWLITNKLIDAFYTQSEYVPFEKVESVMMSFLPICTNQNYKDRLLSVYNQLKKYRSGRPAPNFTLKDENGKQVSLSDFKGKVVLLDFWGVHCGPCIYNLQNEIPEVHKKYKGKNMVFISICVEDTESSWKDAIKSYKIVGINLFAKDWTQNPVCRAFKIGAIPHYILIDKKGNFADYNCSITSLLSDNNILDKALATN